MKGLVKEFQGPEGTLIRNDIKSIKPSYGQIKIQVKAATICGSDIHTYKGRTIDGRLKMPVVIGHEGCGIVIEVGEGVENYVVGDRVVAETTYETCKQCEYCYQAKYNCCDHRKGLGSAVNGFFAEYVTVPERSVHKLPEGISFEAAAMMEPLAVAVRGVMERSHIQAGDVALVIGPGPIGLLAAQVARACGAVVILCDVQKNTQRLKFAEQELGLNYTYGTNDKDLEIFLNKFTYGRGADLVFECTGVNPAIYRGLELLKKQGEFVALGTQSPGIELKYNSLFYTKEISMNGARSTNPSSWVRALRLVQYKKVDIECMVSHVLPLEEWKKGYELVQTGEAIKVVLKP